MKKTFFLFLIFLFLGELNAQDPDISKIPKYLGASNFGSEFWVTIPPAIVDESADHNTFIKIFVISQSKSAITVEIPNWAYSVTQNSIPNDVVEFNIDPYYCNPYGRAMYSKSLPEKIFPGAGIHIYSDQPFACYVAYYDRYTSDGFLAIPVSALGQEYIVAGYNEEGTFGPNYILPGYTAIVAPFDDTQFRFTLGGNPITKTPGGMLPGESILLTLQKGDVWMVSTSGGNQDLSGSKIVSSKPVAVITVNYYAGIPIGNTFGNYSIEMDLPTYTWGKNYIVPKIPDRKYSSIIRVFAKERDTKVFRNGIQIATLDSSGGIEGKAFIELRMNPMDQPPASISISADKPIGVTLYNTGSKEDSNFNVTTDYSPFVMAISPVEQFQKEILFCTPGIKDGQGNKFNFLNFVFETDSTGSISDQYEFCTSINGEFSWEKLKDKFTGTSELLKSPIDGKFYGILTLTLVKGGEYMIRSQTLSFAAYSFGYTNYHSYGYPTAARLRDLTKADTEKPIVKYFVPWFEQLGNLRGSTTTDMPDDLRKRSNIGLIFLHKDLSYNCKFECDDYIPGQVRTVAWDLEVNDITLPAVGVISFYDRCGNDTTIVLKYDPQYYVNAIQLLDPPDSSVNILATQEFSWEKSFTGFHRLQISEVNTFDSKTQSYDLTDTFKTVKGLKPYFTYYWRVLNIKNDTARNIIGGSAIWKFTTGYINSVADNYPENSFNISPNPVINIIEISVGTRRAVSEQSEIRIFNIYGQTVSTVNLTPTLSTSGEGVRINVSGLPPGMYFVMIGDKVGKFVKL